MSNIFDFLKNLGGNGNQQIQPVSNVSGSTSINQPMANPQPPKFNGFTTNDGKTFQQQSPWKQALLQAAIMGGTSAFGGGSVPLTLGMTALGGIAGYGKAKTNNAYIDYEGKQGKQRFDLLNANDEKNLVPDNLGYVSENDFKNYQAVKDQNWKQEYQKGTLDNRELQIKTQEMINSLKAENDLNKLQNQQTTLSTLMGYNPEFAKQYQAMADPNGAYDFTGGRNRTYLESTLKNMGTDINAPMPLAMGQTLIQSKPQQGQAKVGQIKAATGLTQQKTTESKTLLPGKVKKLERDASKPYFKPGSGKPGAYKPENNPEFAGDLADYLNTSDPKQKAWGRGEFIRKHKIDPDKKLQQSNSNYR